MPLFIWQQFPELCAGTTLRSEGNFAAGPAFDSDEKKKALQNRQKLLSGLGFPQFHTARQTHSTTVLRAEGDSSREADALITDQPHELLGLNTADCIPVFIYAPQQGAIGLAHSGRKGLLGGIAEETLKTLQKNFGIAYEDVFVHIGPHISAPSYEVGVDILAEFHISCLGTRGFLDMETILKERLASMGLRSQNITSSGLCTLKAQAPDGSPLFFSHRGRDKERMFSFIGIRRG